MSTDYFLISETHKRAVMVGSDGVSGPKSWTGTPEVVEFVRWAIEDFVKDVRMVDEHTLDVLSGDDYWPGNKVPSPPSHG
jgi:hypothetical protein